MKKRLAFFLILVALCVVFGTQPSQAFNPGAHIYVVDHVYPWYIDKINLHYGSIAPDIVLYASVTDPNDLMALFKATHIELTDLTPYAWWPAQKAFSKGWPTHSQNFEKPGADYFAHVQYDSQADGYAYFKGAKLQLEPEWTGLPDNPEFAHDVIEVVVDLLLKRQDPMLGTKIFNAALLRSWEDRNLIVRLLVWQEGLTDWETLASAELTFREVVTQYAIALSLSSLQNYLPLAQFGKTIAKQAYDIDLTDDQALALIQKGIELCDDYMIPINEAIGALR